MAVAAALFSILVPLKLYLYGVKVPLAGWASKYKPQALWQRLYSTALHSGRWRFDSPACLPPSPRA